MRFLSLTTVHHFIFYTVPVSLDRKSDSEPATGHQFFCLEHDFAISKNSNPFLTPQ
jgi:hypothetical protein